MKLLNKTLKKYGLVPSEYRKIGGATIVGSNNGLFVAKEKNTVQTKIFMSIYHQEILIIIQELLVHKMILLKYLNI